MNKWEEGDIVESMNDEEEDEAFMNYISKGYHYPSRAKVIEDKAALMAFYLKSTKQAKMKIILNTI